VLCSSQQTTFDTVITVFRGSPNGACTIICVGTNDDHGLTDVDLCSHSVLHSVILFESEPPADTYYVAVSGYDATESGSFDLVLVSIPEDGTDTPQDDASCPFTSATWINYDPDGVVIRGTITEFTGAPSNLPDFGDCSITNGSPTVWFQFQTDADATIVLTTW
jgi:hypothetical protein